MVAATSLGDTLTELGGARWELYTGDKLTSEAVLHMLESLGPFTAVLTPWDDVKQAPVLWFGGDLHLGYPENHAFFAHLMQNTAAGRRSDEMLVNWLTKLYGANIGWYYETKIPLVQLERGVTQRHHAVSSGPGSAKPGTNRRRATE
jgi:hypothetical protein